MIISLPRLVFCPRFCFMYLNVYICPICNDTGRVPIPLSEILYE